MHTNTAPVRFVRPRRKPPQQAATSPLQMALIAGGGLALALILLFLFSLAYRIAHMGRIFPGVSVAGVNLSGLTVPEAEALLQSQLTYPQNGRILLRDGANLWVESPARLGMSLDAAASAQAALKVGRSGGLFGSINAQVTAAQTGVLLPPVTQYDQRVAHSYLQNLAAQINLPVAEASLQINGTEVSSQPGQIGRKLNVDASLVYLSVQMQSFRDGEAPLVIEEQSPQVLDASAQAETARRLLSAPLVVSLPNPQPGDPGPWFLEPSTLAPLLKIGRNAAGQYVIQPDRAQLTPFLQQIATQVDRAEENARFVFNDETAQLELIQSATVGLKVDVSASLDALETAIAAGQSAAELQVIRTEPQVANTATAADLGITQLVSAETSYFFGSTAARLQNIQAASSRFHGVLVAPGETFSMGKYLGDVSLENGFAEALIIYGGRTIKGVGGGVCQVSTTLFRTAFFGGFPINERYAHAYRVGYYEQRANGSIDTLLAGFDATVYFPLVDFKFTNDTPHWLLMETYYNEAGRSLTWKFYSTSDGRSVTFDTTGPTNITPAPAPVMQENPELREGEIKQVDWAAEGADVTINRIVNRDGKILFVDKFTTHYEPWQAVCEYGPGTKDPEKALKKAGLCQ